MRTLLEFTSAPADHAALSDFAWARLTPWRRLTTQFFDVAATLPILDLIDEATLTYANSPNRWSGFTGALLFAGWLGSRLNWRTPGELLPVRGDPNVWRATLRAGTAGRQREVTLTLRPTAKPLAASTLLDVRLAADGGKAGFFTVERLDGNEISTTSDARSCQTSSVPYSLRCRPRPISWARSCAFSATTPFSKPRWRSPPTWPPRASRERDRGERRRQVGKRGPRVTGAIANSAAGRGAILLAAPPSSPDDLRPRSTSDRAGRCIVPDGSALARAAAERFACAVEQAVSERGHAFVALSGGTTPKQMGSILAREPYRSRIPWDRVHVFWGDERWVPLGSPESNAGEARRGFLDLVPIPPAMSTPGTRPRNPPGKRLPPTKACCANSFGEPSGIPRFDLVLLGMGDDGHTASLFPDTDALVADGRLAVANYVPKMDASRLTLTAPLLNAGREILFLVGGPGKADTLEAVLEGPGAAGEFPGAIDSTSPA